MSVTVKLVLKEINCSTCVAGIYRHNLSQFGIYNMICIYNVYTIYISLYHVAVECMLADTVFLNTSPFTLSTLLIIKYYIKYTHSMR